MDVVIGVEWQGTRTGEGMKGKERGNGRRRGEKGGDSTLSRLKSWVRHGQMQNASGRSLFMSRLYVFLNAKKRCQSSIHTEHSMEKHCWKNISKITLFSFYESMNLNNHIALITTHLQAASLTY